MCCMAAAEKLLNRICANQLFLSFENISRVAQKSILGFRGRFCARQGCAGGGGLNRPPQALCGYQMRSQPQNCRRFNFFKSRQNSNLFKPFDSGSRWGQISRVLLLLCRKKSTGVISAWISWRSDLVEMQQKQRFLAFRAA